MGGSGGIGQRTGGRLGCLVGKRRRRRRAAESVGQRRQVRLLELYNLPFAISIYYQKRLGLTSRTLGQLPRHDGDGVFVVVQSKFG